ncbi:MAG: DUF11 domain-containing protein, partial [Phaeodactylibacter sp.]|nr:DUF11 domain-containing protein [Phaeodactylibacter sp.]
TPNVGDVVTFTITVSNQGPGNATGVAVEDYLPNGYSNISNISGGGTLSGSTITWSGLSIASGGSVSLTFNATVGAPGTGVSFENVAQVTASDQDDPDSTPDNDDGDQSEDDEDSATTSPQQADLSLLKTVSNSTPSVGDVVTFTITVSNQGPSDATGVAVEDYLPNGYSGISNISNGGTFAGGTITWSGLSIASGSSVSLTFNASIEPLIPGIDYKNVAQVTASDQDDPDSTPNNDDGDQSEDDEDMVQVNPTQLVDLELDKSVNNAQPNLGASVTFTIQLTNQGPSTATGVVVQDLLSGGLTYTSHSGPGSYNPVTGLWNVGTLPAGQSVSLMITTVVESEVAINLAEVVQVNEDDADSTPGNGVDTDADGNVQDDPGDEDDGDGVVIEVACDIAAQVSNVQCDDNGTPSNPNDDTYTFQLLVTGVGTGNNGWVDAANGISGNYGQAVTYGPFTILGNPNLFLTIRDADDSGCTATAQVQAPLTCSDECRIRANLIGTPVCDDNGTPSNPNDDTYTFQIQVIGNNTSTSGWTSNTGATGDYNEVVTFGPYPVSQGSRLMVFTDASDPNCNATILVQAPATCSDQCLITAQVTGTPCDDNGTPFDPDDDTYYVVVYVGGVNTGGTWISNTGIQGTYNNYAAFGPYSVTADMVSFTFTDLNDPSCTASVTAFAPPPCSFQCELDVNVLGTNCNDNGTPTDPTDDTFTFNVVVTGINIGNGWRQVYYNGSLGPVRPYGVPVTIGPYPISGGDVDIRIRDITDSGCRSDFTVAAPDPCSAACDITATASTAVCDDNGTLSNPDDDTYSFQLTVSGVNTGGGWTATVNGQPVSGNYNTPVLVSGLLILDGDVTIDDITDNQDATCVAPAVTVVAPAPCSDVCILTATATASDCDDNGTPADPTDDVYRVTLTVTGQNTGCTSWTAVVNGITRTGTIGQPIVIGGIPAGQDAVITNIQCVDDPNCTASPVTVTAPGPCSNQCLITASATDAICDDHGTPTDPSDDTFSFGLTVTGVNAGSGWTATVNGQLIASGTYGNPVQVTGLPISGGDITIIVTDNDDSNCTAMPVNVTAPPACSGLEPCSITAEVVEFICNDNGTPGMNADDTFTFRVLVTNTGVGSSWTADDGTTGQYGQEVLFGPYPSIAGTIFNFIITDDDDPGCQYDLEVTAPNCSNDCNLTPTIVSESCDDQGTADPSDDTFTCVIIIDGDFVGTTWTATTGEMGVFGEPYTFGPYPIGNNVIFNVYPDANDNCVLAVFLASPPPCSVQPCGIDANISDIECFDNNTPLDPSDDFFNFTATVTGDTVGTNWLAYDSDGNLINFGNFDVPKLINVPFLISDGDAVIRFVDASNPDCFTIVTVPAPPVCSEQCQIAASYSDVLCDDNGTPLDPSDDTYTFSLLVTNGSFAGQWEAQIMGGGTITGDYGTAVTVGPFNIGGGDITIEEIRDADFPACVTDAALTIPAPNPCSAVCEIAAGFDDVRCDDNGTPLDPSDDTYTFTLLVTNGSLAGQWEAEIGGVTIAGSYGTAVTTGPYDIADGNVVIENIRDVNDPTCVVAADVTVPVPAACSGDCQIAASIGSVLCDPNGTPLDPSDDTYTFTLVVANGSLAGQWEAEVNGVTITGSYSTPVTVGPYNIADGDVAVENIRDADFPACALSAALDVTAPATCSGGLIVDCPLSTHYCPILDEDIMLFPTGPWDCSADIEAPLPDVTTSCATGGYEVITELVQYVNGVPVVLETILPGDPRLITGVGLGDYVFRYTVTDDCGNTAVIECPLRVADLSEPVAICKSGLNISVGGFGLARVYAHQIDEGSYDNCGIDSILVRRVYHRDPLTCDTILQPYYSDWGPYVEFTCCDAGTYVTVELRVVDIHGNVNMCWLDILVEDKTLPYCYNLEDVEVSCDSLPADFDPYDTVQLGILFGEPEVFDNCAADAIEYDPVVQWSGCGNGTILRRFRAIDRVGNLSIDTFYQWIYVGSLGGYDIRFPQDASLSCNEANPDTVRVYHNGCDSITVSYVDSLAASSNGECRRVFRTYTVTNWCEWDGIADPMVISRDEDCDGLAGEEDVWVLYRLDSTFVDADSLAYNLWPLAGTKDTACDGTSNPDGYWRLANSVGAWQYTQILYVYDTVAPVVHFTPPAPVCAMDDDCEAELTYSFTVEEHCSADSLSFTVFLDEGADGLLDGDITDDVQLIGSYPLFAIRGIFPVGVHALQLHVEDGCGNSSIDSLPFEVVDCFVEAPLCFDGLIVQLMPLPDGTDVDGDGDEDAAAMLVHVDYLLESLIADDCSMPLRYSINRVGEEPNMLQDSIYVTCDDPDILPVEVYAWDSANNPYAVQPDGSIGGRNYSPCATTVTLQNKSVSCGLGRGQGGGATLPQVTDGENPVLYQNQPNPFLRNTTIRFWLPEAGQAEIVVTDLTGKAVKRYRGLYDAGFHEIEVKPEELRGYGMYFYSLRTADYIETRQMIYLE